MRMHTKIYGEKKEIVQLDFTENSFNVTLSNPPFKKIYIIIKV